jgi:hypothetical protein
MGSIGHLNTASSPRNDFGIIKGKINMTEAVERVALPVAFCSLT